MTLVLPPPCARPCPMFTRAPNRKATFMSHDISKSGNLIGLPIFRTCRVSTTDQTGGGDYNAFRLSDFRAMESYRAYKKSTSAYYPPFPSASQSSTNKWFNPYTLVTSRAETGDSSEYTLRDLLGCPPGSNHQEAYRAIKDWLTNRLSLTGGGEDLH